MGSKIFFFSITFIISTFLGDVLSLPILAGIAIIIALTAAVRFFLCNKEMTAIYILLFMIAGAGNMYLYSSAMNQMQYYESNNATLYGTVAEIKYTSLNSAQYIVENKQINQNNKLSSIGKYTKLTVIRPDKTFNIGDNIQIEGTLMHVNSLVPQGGFDSTRYYKSKNIAFEISAPCNQVSFVDKQKITIDKWPQIVRDKMIDTTGKYIDADNCGILTAMIVGEKSLLDSYQKELFNDSGMAHILAVSGLHVGILLLFLTFFFRKLRLPRTAIKILSILSLLGFMFVMDFSISVTRAVIMTILLIVSQLIFEENDPLASLCIAAVIITGINPFAIYDASFLLSFGATLGISLFYKPIKDSCDNKIPKFASANFSLSISSSIIILPILVYFFNRFSIISPFTNIIVIPIFTLLMFVGFCMLLVSFVFAPAAAFLGFIANFLIEAIVWILEIMTAMKQTILTLKSSSPIEFIFYFALAYLLYQFLTNRKWKAAVLILSFATSGFLYYTISESFKDKIYFMSGSVFDTTLVQTAYGKNVLICGYNDSINEGDFDYGVDCLISNLAKVGIDHVNYFIPSNQTPYTARIISEIKNDIKIDTVLLASQEMPEDFKIQLERTGVSLSYADDNWLPLSKYSSVLCVEPDSIQFRLQDTDFIADSNIRYGNENRIMEHMEQAYIYKVQTTSVDDIKNIGNTEVALLLAPYEEKEAYLERFRAAFPDTVCLSVQQYGTVTVKVQNDKVTAVVPEKRR